MSVQTYIGARYVPRFLGVYDITQQYEALDVVDNGSGTSYISRKTTPPGVPLTDTEYWAIYGAASGAIINLQNQINDIDAVLYDIYANVSDMQAADLAPGKVVHTAGYYTAGDGGSADYIIKTSSTKINVSLTNGNVAELIYDDTVNVKQAGAHGDGVTDDTTVFQSLLSTVTNLVVPEGEYKITDNLILNNYQTIKGSHISVSDTPKLEITGGSIIVKGRYNEIGGLSLKGDTINNMIVIGESGDVVSNLTLKDLIISNSNIGIVSGGLSAFLIRIDNVRIITSTDGIVLKDTFAVELNRYYPNDLVRLIRLENCLNTLIINSNIGYKANSVITIMDGSNADFINCHFECDFQKSNYMFNAMSRRVSFRNCDFLVNGDSTAHIIAIDQMEAVSFENCRYVRSASSPGTFPVVDPNTFGGANYGALIFEAGTSSFPRPTGLTATQHPYWVDKFNNKTIEFTGTSIDKTRLTAGAILYSRSASKLCIFDGTNIVDMSGTIIV